MKPKTSKNYIATVDRAHGTLKKALEIKKGGWADRLNAVVSGMNNAPHAGVANLAPNKVEEAPDTKFQLQKQNMEKMAETAEAIKKASGRIAKDRGVPCRNSASKERRPTNNRREVWWGSSQGR